MATPSKSVPLPKQATVFDLTTFDEVTIRKVGSFSPVESAKEALERLGNDSTKFLEILNVGLKSQALRDLANDTQVPWMIEDEDTGELKPFAGIPADGSKVNPLVLTIAKTVFKYNKDMDADAKRAAKDKARELIRNNPAMVAGLKESAMADGE
jgi:hypothetical protein